MAKKQYHDMSGSSGVTRYELHHDGITVYFGSKPYKYTNASAGADHVKRMKELAEAGVGLAGHIREHKPGHVKGN